MFGKIVIYFGETGISRFRKNISCVITYSRPSTSLHCVYIQMSAASNDNEQASDLDEPMGSQSQVRDQIILSCSDNIDNELSSILCFMLSGQDSEFSFVFEIIIR